MASYSMSRNHVMMNQLKPSLRLGFLGLFSCGSSLPSSFFFHHRHHASIHARAKRPTAISCNAAKLGSRTESAATSIFPFALFTFRYSLSTRAEKLAPIVKQINDAPPHAHAHAHAQAAPALDHPGGKVEFTSKLHILPESRPERIDCYRILDENGEPTSTDFEPMSRELAIKVYSNMVGLRIMDSVFSEAQKKGRISLYLTTEGEEAINIASAAALEMDDLIFPQYREAGVLMWRGFSLPEFANQCFGNKHDGGKGRQMPIHYASNPLNYFTVSSTIATQIPHAVGAAYSLKMDRVNACAVTYFGEGSTSMGDFHGAINFAAVLETPIIFVCRNNGWAISTPVEQQFRSDGIAVKGEGYGVQSIRVDGNDALATYTAVSAARRIAIHHQRPVLIEALTYRSSHHTTSDDSTKYRPAEEIEWWKVTQDPVARFRKWLQLNNWWDFGSEKDLVTSLKMQAIQAIEDAANVEKPPIGDIFTDVYDAPPTNLQEQETLLKQTIKKHPQDYPPNFTDFKVIANQ